MRLEAILLTALLVGCGGVEKDVRETSSNLRVKAKSGAVWRNDVAGGLELDASEVCVELGQYDCIDFAHRITMGGVEPEKLGIDKPLENSPASAPIAFDRAAINACARRYQLDLEGAPVVFGPVLSNNTAEAREEVAEQLVRRLLGRKATDDQRKDLAALYDTLAPLSSDVTADWSVGACVVVATSIEALFY